MPDVPFCDHLKDPPPAPRRLMRAASTNGTKLIALTFDDGPSGTDSTERVLAVLDSYGINATFCVVGSMIDYNPDKVVAEFQAGHLIENHSRTHPEFSTLSYDQMVEEIDTTTSQIVNLGIPTPAYFRPPYGDGDGSSLTSILSDRGLTPLYWSIDSRDWEIPDAETVHQNVLSDLRAAWNAGNLANIILFHDIQPHTPDAVDALIPDLQGEGCEFVLVDAIV